MHQKRISGLTFMRKVHTQIDINRTRGNWNLSFLIIYILMQGELKTYVECCKSWHYRGTYSDEDTLRLRELYDQMRHIKLNNKNTNFEENSKRKVPYQMAISKAQTHQPNGQQLSCS